METVYSRLRAWRWSKAQELQVPAFFILSNAQLAGLAASLPSSLEELAACPGVGPKKLAQFGDSLLELIAQCALEGLDSGVTPPVPAEPPVDLTAEHLAEIAAGLRKELVQRLNRRFKGRYTTGQLEEALRRLSVPA